MDIMEILPEPIEFEWDKGNQEKNWIKHGVSIQECAEAFFDQNKKVAYDFSHSKGEDRLILIGNTNQSRLLYVSFTIRRRKVRVISARDLNKKERKLYEKRT